MMLTAPASPARYGCPLHARPASRPINISAAVLIFLGIALTPSAAAAETETGAGAEALALGSDRELFVDNHLVERLDGVRLKLHRPQPLPLARSPLRGTYATVIKDGSLFRAWYRDVIPGYEGPRGDGHAGEITRYAESRDGHEWTFPELGLFEINGSRDNNVVFAQQPFSHNFSPLLDDRPGVPAAERYKAVAGGRQDIMDRIAAPGSRRQGGLYAFVSADGLRWKPMSEAPILTAGRFDSQNVAFWSEAEGRYVCYFRDLTSDKLRTIARSTSADFRTWTTPVALHPNLPGEHLYTSQTHPYFRAPHLYVALPTRFVPSRGDSTDILFMTSRRGAPYARLFKESFIRPGLDPARWGNRSNYAALNVVPTGPGEMSIYHVHSGHRHVLRTDGFTSLHASHEGGEVLTKPFTFTGRRLMLNYATSASGGLRVEIQDPAGRPLEGFTLADCPELVGDIIDHPVSWTAGPEVSRLAGRPIRLRFVLRDADLYALQFVE